MKIIFDGNNTNQSVDKAAASYRNTQSPRTDYAGGYALDISGKVMDNNAYKGQGKTAEEVMQDAGLIDVATQRDYMTVMSNCMSDEDFRKLQKEGYQPGSMEMEEAVTIVDTIKAELLKGGTEVSGYTDDLDKDTLKEITGSEAFAQELCRQFERHDIPVTEENAADAKEAYDKVTAMKAPGEGTVKYMVENRMEPTIDEFYRADYSASTVSIRQGHGYYAEENTGYYAKKAEEYNWEQLMPQIEKIIEQTGLTVNGESVGEAKWLVKSGIPLTEESLGRLHAIKQADFQQSTAQILSAVAAAISDGKGAGGANLADGRSSYEKAAEYAESFEKISDEAVDKTVASGETVTLRNLEKAQEELLQASAGQGREQQAEDLDGAYQKEAVELTTEQITARRQLEEVRLMMTIEANRKLLMSGYSIDTAELEELVESLKEIEARQNQLFWGESSAAEGAEKSALWREVQQKAAEIPYLPAAVLGRFVSGEVFTLDSAYESGTALRSAYEAARESYETLMTVSREDLGDSIKKAFQNIDDILKDMGLEGSEENRRAVRILGYNSMDISNENMDAVKKYDMELQETIRKMTPQASMQAIRDGVNPLMISLEELNAYLDSLEISKEGKQEKFSKYLYKLEKKHDITPTERKAYIGIYRMFRQLEKTDNAAVGSLLREGREISFYNLLTSMRSTKRQGMDYAVDEHFGGVDSVSLNKPIMNQIMDGFSGYYEALAGKIADSLEPEMLQQMSLEPEMTMEQFAEALARTQADEELERAYVQEQVQQYREFQDVEDSVVQELLDYQQPVTADNLLAAENLRKHSESLYKKLNDLDKSAGRHKYKDAVLGLIENLTGRDEAVEAYGKMEQSFREILEDAQEDEEITYLDVRALQSFRKQLALAGNLAREENYQIPVEINGELTAINLRVRHGAGGGKVSAFMETESYGQVAAQFNVRNNTVSGYIACDRQDGVKALQQKEADLKAGLGDVLRVDGKPVKVGTLGIVYSKEISVENDTRDDSVSDSRTATADLYKIAKAFITTVTE